MNPRIFCSCPAKRPPCPASFPGTTPKGPSPVREFVRRYASLGGHVPDNLRLDRYGAMEFPSAIGLRPLVDGLLVPGGLTTIVESRLVEPNLLSTKLLAALGRGEDVLAGRWRNLAGRPIRRLAFIDIERLTPYVELLRQFGETGDRDQDLLFHPGFLGKPMEEGMADFKAILRENTPQVVVFDTEAVPWRTCREAPVPGGAALWPDGGYRPGGGCPRRERPRRSSPMPALSWPASRSMTTPPSTIS